MFISFRLSGRRVYELCPSVCIALSRAVGAFYCPVEPNFCFSLSRGCSRATKRPILSFHICQPAIQRYFPLLCVCRVQLFKQFGVRGLHSLLPGDHRPLLSIHHPERTRRAPFPERSLPQIGGLQEYSPLPGCLYGVADVRRLHSRSRVEEDSRQRYARLSVCLIWKAV